MAKNVKSKPKIDTVDTATVEAAIRAKDIGKKIRQLRLKRSMGLAELGRQVGLSASFLSQVETGRVIPTMRNLSRIALAFKQDFSYFLAEDENCFFFRISRAKDRIRLHIQEKEVTIVLADNLGILLPDHQAVPCVADFLTGAEGAPFRPRIFAGLELVYVISGSLVLSTEHTTEVLHPEDSAWVDSNSSRHYRCHGEEPARALIMTFPVRS